MTSHYLNQWCPSSCLQANFGWHDDVIKWKHFPRYWSFVRGIHPVNAPHKGHWRRALMFSLICARIDGWLNNLEAGDLRRYRAHYDVIVMKISLQVQTCWPRIMLFTPPVQELRRQVNGLWAIPCPLKQFIVLLNTLPSLVITGAWRHASKHYDWYHTDDI